MPRVVLLSVLIFGPPAYPLDTMTPSFAAIAPLRPASALVPADPVEGCLKPKEALVKGQQVRMVPGPAV